MALFFSTAKQLSNKNLSKRQKRLYTDCTCFVEFVECTVVLSSMPVSNFILTKVFPLQEHYQKDFYAKPIVVFEMLDILALSSNQRYFCYLSLCSYCVLSGFISYCSCSLYPILWNLIKCVCVSIPIIES